MAALPTETTARLIVNYVWRGIQHSVLYRWPGAVSKAAAIGAIEAHNLELKTLGWSTWAVAGTAKWYPLGSLVSSDEVIAVPGAGTGGADPGNAVPDAQQWQVVGRSPDGRRASWFFGGLDITQRANQRTYEAESASVVTLLDSMRDLVLVGLCTISGEAPVLKAYVNEVMNDELTRKARRG